MRRGLRIVAGALALAASVFAIACGSDDESAASGLATLAPPDAPFYLEGVIDPDDDQAEAIDSFTERLGGGFDPGAALTAEVDDLFASNGLDLTYADDVEPWIGDEASVFVRSFEPPAGSSGMPDFAVMLSVDDADSARDFIDRLFAADDGQVEQRDYLGTDYFLSSGDVSTSAVGGAVGIVDDRALVFGTEQSFKVAVDASQGESLAGSDEYSSHMEPLPDNPLATAFFEPATAIEAAIASSEVDGADVHMLEPLLGGPLSEPIAASLTASADTASFDVAASIDSDAPDSTESSLLENLPGGSWFAAALPNLGPTLERNLDQISSSGLPGAGQIDAQVEQATGLDLGTLFAWLGDAAIFVEGTAPPAFSAGLIAETSDPDGPRRLLDTVQRMLESQTGGRSTGTPDGADYGFSFGIPGLGTGAEAGVVDDMLVAVVGVGLDQALHPDQVLGDDPGYADAVAALGEGMAPALFVDLPELFAIAEVGAADDLPGEDGVDYDAIRPYVGELGSLIAGSRHADGLVVTRLTLTLSQ